MHIYSLSNLASVSAEPSTHSDKPSPLPFTLSQAALPCLQVSPMPNGNMIEAKRLKDLQDLQGKELLKKYQLTESMKNIFWQLYCLSNECSQLTNKKK